MLMKHVPMACVIAAATLTTSTSADLTNKADRDKPLVSGAFIQLNEASASREGDWWRQQLSDMNVIGMDTVVIQYVGYGDQYYYPTRVEGAQPINNDCLEHILSAADQAGMHVFLGLQLNSNFWSGAFDGDANIKRNRATLEELHKRYGTHTSLIGWYIPEEVSDHTPHKPEFADALLKYMGEISELAKHSTGMPVMISPYFGQAPEAQAYAQWWDQVALPKLHIDILAMQDGVGTHRTSIEESRPIYEALAPVLQRHGVAFWANNECFDQTHGWPIDDQAWSAQPVDFDTFIKQVRSTSPFVEKIISFEFTNYMSPTNRGRSQALYEAYRNYYGIITGAQQPATYIKVPHPTTRRTHEGVTDIAGSRTE